MESDSKIKKIINVIVIAIGFFGSVIGIYSYYSSGDIELQYQIVSSTNVLDANTKIDSLNILYQGENLKASNSDLKIITLKVVNNSTKPILMDYYDDSNLLGVYVKNGHLIEKPEVIMSSSDYIKNNLITELRNQQEIRFSKIILDPKEYFVLKVNVIHTVNIDPEISALGKIANVKAIKIAYDLNNQNSNSFWSRVFDGNILIQLVRLLVYTLTSLIILLSIIFIFAFTSEQYQKNKKRKYINEFKNKGGYYYKKIDDVIFNLYLEEDGLYFLRSAIDLLENQDKLNLEYEVFYKKSQENTHLNEVVFHYSPQRIISKMIDAGIISFSKNGLEVNSQMAKTMKDLREFLRGKSKEDPLELLSFNKHLKRHSRRKSTRKL